MQHAWVWMHTERINYYYRAQWSDLWAARCLPVCAEDVPRPLAHVHGAPDVTTLPLLHPAKHKRIDI